MKMIVCGGRDYELSSDDFEWLALWIEHYGVTEVIHGACRGVDRDAGGFAMGLGITVTIFPAEKYGKWPGCGPIRNQAMADYCEPGDVCAVFPGGKGTASMMKKAEARGLRILRQVPSD
jgi:hypothetical protein